MATLQRSGWILGMALMLISGCASTPDKMAADGAPAAARPASAMDSGGGSTLLIGDDTEEATGPRGADITRGSGQFINSAAAKRRAKALAQGDITLNFENTSIDEVVKLVLGDILGENYTLDPAVKGSVTLKTTKPVKRDALLPILEELLKMNGAAMVWNDGLYRVTPLSGAARNAMPPRVRNGAGDPGFGVQIIQLRYIAAKEMMKLLEPMVPKENQIMVDEHRNLIVVAGTGRELQGWRETAEIFDVDWMSGHSIGVFPLHYADAKTLAEELNRIVGQHMNADSAGMVRIEALDRLNSILVLTPQPRYLEQMQVWIERLDRVGEGPGTRLFAYAVKNRKASELAAVLTSVFGGASAGGVMPAKAPAMAPGLKPVKLSTAKGGDAAAAAVPDISAQGQSLTLPAGGVVRIVADESNNAILVMASAQDFKLIESALKRLDVQEMQVLIEASILEVSLTDELSYGLEWYIKQNKFHKNYSTEALLDLNTTSGIGPTIPGFSYTITGGTNVSAVLNALATDSKLNVISSPSLMVLDNRTARITVGDQVPVRTETATTEGGVIIESIQFKDTGVQLEVKPRINNGGLITLDIRQDVTDAGERDAATGQRSFRQRNIESTIAIQSGDTIMLGGLITENNTDTESGVPGLSKLPLIGALFGKTTESKRRTELVVLITPRVVRTSDDARLLTDEFRLRMNSLSQRAQQTLATPQP